MALGELGTHTAEEIARLEPGMAKVAEPLQATLGSFGVSPENASDSHARWETQLAVLRALHKAGVPIVAGTDQAVPGHSLHREIELYVEAGFTPMEAIQAATVVPSKAMGVSNEVGTVEVGKRADLILLDANPLEDIHNIRSVRYVI